MLRRPPGEGARGPGEGAAPRAVSASRAPPHGLLFAGGAGAAGPPSPHPFPAGAQAAGRGLRASSRQAGAGQRAGSAPPPPLGSRGLHYEIGAVAAAGPRRRHVAGEGEEAGDMAAAACWGRLFPVRPGAACG